MNREENNEKLPRLCRRGLARAYLGVGDHAFRKMEAAGIIGKVKLAGNARAFFRREDLMKITTKTGE